MLAMHAYCTVLLSTYYKCGGSDTFWFWSLIWSNPTFHSVRSLFHILLSFSVKSNLGHAKIPNYSSNFQPFHFFWDLGSGFRKPLNPDTDPNHWIYILIMFREGWAWVCGRSTLTSGPSRRSCGCTWRPAAPSAATTSRTGAISSGAASGSATTPGSSSVETSPRSWGLSIHRVSTSSGRGP